MNINEIDLDIINSILENLIGINKDPISKGYNTLFKLGRTNKNQIERIQKILAD